MEPQRLTRGITTGILILISLLLLAPCAVAGDLLPTGPKLEPRKGRFLVATSNLANSSFKETVIFVTHYSAAGATGITINRPANIPINEAFPNIKELTDISNTLYLGGPVKTDGIFVLMKTRRPHAGMKQIVDDIYFTVGLNAVMHGIPNAIEGEATRAYAGYSGWAPGQLQVEIERGDWIIAESDTSIIFDKDTEALWPRLYKTWSGNWI